ncbi:unnamed protein product [Acanthosepion pharaonis]|uniref:Uncharacterized protein n=1 Tax=Acanthosepion pharaonis TaxID=158019 RepID=A0A812BBR8_ACAPH|nr:unnamed protein product [Sepia pharaonis]
MNAQGAATASASRVSVTHHQSLLRNVRKTAATAKSRAIETLDRRSACQSRDATATARARAAETTLRRICAKCYECCYHRQVEGSRVRQSRDAAATETARAAANPLRKTVRNATNAATTATTARSRAAETFDRRRAHQSRDAAATARSRVSESALAGQPAMPATLQRLLLPEIPRANRQGQRDFQGLLQTWPLCAYLKFPKLAEHASAASFRVPRSDVILLLQALRHEVKSYICNFKYAFENAPVPSFSIVIDADKRPHNEYERRYNAPACNEMAAIIHGKQDLTRDIVLKSRGGALCRISESHRSYDASQYPLHFPYVDDG